MKVEYGDEEFMLTQLQSNGLIKHFSLSERTICWDTKILFEHDLILCVSRSMQFWLSNVCVLDESVITVATCLEEDCKGKFPISTMRLFLSPPTRNDVWTGSNQIVCGGIVKQML